MWTCDHRAYRIAWETSRIACSWRSHSIGVPLAVAADHSFIVKSAAMMIHQ